MNRTWVEIHANALRSNIAALGSLLAPEAQFCAVVKANAYGHDLETIVRLAALEGVRIFAVDSLDEAIKVRRMQPEANVMILGWTPNERLKEVVQHHLIQTVYDEPTIEALGACALEQQTPARLNLKIETGTMRQGVRPEQLQRLFYRIKQEGEAVELCGVSSHFANSEDAKHPQFMEEQNARFQQAVRLVFEAGFRPSLIHTACSAAAILYPDTHYHLARFGISLYGLWSSASTRSKNRTSARAIDLKPVLSWKTRIAQLKDVSPGETIGYGRAFRADRPMRIAVLPVGYYDGYRRAMSGKAHVLVRGQTCRVLGTICMNMCMIDVSLLPQVQVGEVVTLLGKQGMHAVTAQDLAEWAETIHYEVVTQISPHLPRIVV